MDYPKRKSNRLQGYDYGQNGAYFITICTKDKKCILSRVVDESNGFDVIRRDRACPCPKIILSELGAICERAINEIQIKFGVEVSDFVIMPNHIHLIIFINYADNSKEMRTGASPVPTISISTVIGCLKSIIACSWLETCKEGNRKMGKIWQRSYYDHVIRNDEDYYLRARYIQENPLRWILKNNL